MRALKIILLSGFLLFLAAVLGAAYIFFIRPLTLPVYQFNQQPSMQRGNFTASTLDFGVARYISDASDFPLELEGSAGILSMIGRTQDGMDVYAIPGLDSKQYVMLTTEMFPAQIFRNSGLPPIRPGATRFDAIRLLANLSGQPGAGISAETRNMAVVTEVSDRIARREGVVQKGSSIRGGALHLLSDDLPGVAYLVYAYVEPGGQVFLAEKVSPDDWIPAGPAFTRWLCGAAIEICQSEN